MAGIIYGMHACTVRESLIRIQTRGLVNRCVILHLVVRMAHGHIKEFDSAKETVDDFHQRFEFYCTANNIKSDDEAQQACKKALFITMLGQITSVKLRDLTNPADIVALSLDHVVQHTTSQRPSR